MLRILCLLAAFLSLVVGVMELTQVTAGVGGIGGACFWAIIARMAQADADTNRLLAAINSQQIALAGPVAAAAAKPAPLPKWMQS